MLQALITSWIRELMPACGEVPAESSNVFWSLEQSSLIDENADILTAHESGIDKRS